MSQLWRRVALAGAVGSFGCGTFSCGIGFGLIYRTEQVYQEQYLRERELLEPLLASDPAFADVRCHRRSNGGAFLGGTVPARADHDRLCERLTRLVGEARARELVIGASARE